jgi:LPXTG-motif cell wall-anchored protein
MEFRVAGLSRKTHISRGERDRSSTVLAGSRFVQASSTVLACTLRSRPMRGDGASRGGGCTARGRHGNLVGGVMRWRSEVILAVSLVSAFAQPAALLAQAAQVPTECACLLRPDKPHGPGHPDPGTPGVPETPGTPGTPGGPGTPDSLDSANPRRTWVYLGAAGVALLAGLPLGSSGVQGLPFAAAGTPAAPSGRSVAEATPAPNATAEVPIVSRGDVAPSAPMLASATPTPAAPVTPEAPEAGSPMAMLGLVPPKTATHLPLLAALGVLLVGAGGLLARRASRERRRRRRFVAI